MAAPFRKYGITITAIISLFIFSSSFAQSGKTMRINAYGVNMTFSTDRSKIKSNELASNVLRIVNNTGKEMELSLQITPPAGWKMFGKQVQQIKIKAKDSLFFPVRIRPFATIKGNTNYVVNAFLSSKDFTITNAMWYIAVDKISHWSVYTPETKIYFTGNGDTTKFEVQLRNSGNSDEALQVTLNPEKELEILDNAGNVVFNNTYPVFLKVGRDTTLRFNIRHKNDEDLPVNNSGESDKYQESKRYRVKIMVKNERPIKHGANKLWTGNIDCLILPNKTKIMDASVESLPMTVEMNVYDMMTQSTYSALNIYGNRRFKNNSMLTYYYQANFVNNQIELNSYLGNYLFLGYYHKLFSFELGDIGSNRPGSTLNGKGIKAALNFGGNTLGGLFIRKPKLFDRYYAQGYGGFHTYRSKKLFVDNYYQHINNSWRKVEGDFATTDWNWRISRNQIIRFGGGYSLENHYWIPGDIKHLTGFGWKLGYSGNFRKFNFSANSYYGSRDYTPMRGTFSINGNAGYRINKTYTLSASGYHFSFNPNIYTYGRLVNDSLYNIQDNYSLKLNYQKDINVFIFQPKYYTISSNPIESRTAGMAFEYRRLSRNAFKFFINLFAGYTGFTRNPDLKDIFVSYVQSSVRYKRLQFNVRYYYGPYYTIEQVDYLRTRINPQKFYSTLFYDYWFLKNKMKLNLNLNYFYTTIHSRSQLITRPELFYYAPNGFRFSLYARYSFYAEGAYTRKQYHAGSNNYTEEIVPASATDRFEVGAGIKFNVNMPVGIKRYYRIKVIAFRDLNGNGVMDPGEKGINDMLIMLTKNDTLGNMNTPDEDLNMRPKVYELVTNGKGLVEYDNIPVGEYVITAKPLTAMGGWFDGKTFYRTIDKNKVIYIPLSKGARLSGGILLERARFSNNKPVYLGNIRVTAVNVDNGKTFSTLTDKDGQFVLFVPNGTFKITINEAAVGSRFEFLQNNIPIKITKDFENYNVSFYLVEKQRKIRMGGSSKTPTMPVRRPEVKTQNPEQGSLEKDSVGANPELMPVTQITPDSTKYVVQLFAGEQTRELKTTFDAISSFTNVVCVKGRSGGYIYFTKPFDKKGKAKKMLKKVKKAGFDNASIVPYILP